MKDVKIINLSSQDLNFGPYYNKKTIPAADKPLDITQRNYARNSDCDDTPTISALALAGYHFVDCRWEVLFPFPKEEGAIYVVDEHVAMQLDRTQFLSCVYTQSELKRKDDKENMLIVDWKED